MSQTTRAWLLYWNLDRPIVYFGRPVAKVDSRTIRKAAQRAGVAEWLRFNRYALRHYMATRIRRVERIHVTREERATWMGHKDPHHSTTEAWYESFDPDYLLVSDALDNLPSPARSRKATYDAAPTSRSAARTHRSADGADEGDGCDHDRTHPPGQETLARCANCGARRDPVFDHPGEEDRNR